MSFADMRKTSQSKKSSPSNSLASKKRSNQEIQKTAARIQEARDQETSRLVAAGNLIPRSEPNISAPRVQFSEPIQVGKRDTTPTQIYEEAVEIGARSNLDQEITSTLQKKAQIQQQLNTYAFENNGAVEQALSSQLKSLEAEIDRLENIRAEQAGAAAQKAQQDKIKRYVDKSGLGDEYFTQSNLKARQAELEKEKKRLENELAKMGASTYDAMLDADGKQLAEKDRVSKELEEVNAEMRFIANSYSGLRDAETQQKVATTAQSQYESRRTAESVLDAVSKLIDAPHTGISTAEQNAAVQKVESELGLSLSSFGGDVQAFARAAQSRAVAAVADANKAWEKAGLTSEEYASMVRMESDKVHQQTSEANAKKITEFAEDYPTLASLISIVASPAQGIDFVNQTLRYAEGSDITNLDSYVPADTSHMGVTNFVTGIRSTVGGRLADQYTAEVLDQNVAEFLYNTGMSAADSMAQVATFGPASIYVMGLSSASNTAKSVIDSGGTNGQAFAMGLAAGVAEALCEKVSVDKLLDMLTADNVESIAQAVGKVLSQTGSEASEEFITEIANTIAEAYIMEGESAFRKKVAEYEKTLGERDAVNKALGDILVQAGISGVAGALSGFVSGSAVMGAQVTPTAGGSLPLVAPKSAARKTGSASTTSVSPAAAPEVQRAAQQEQVTKQQNPEATVLDAATTMYFDIAENKGKNTMKKAALKADIVNRLITGEKVEDGEINALNLTDRGYRDVFTKLTGVQFPDGKLQVEQLRSIARSAHTVAQQAKQVQAAPAAPVAPVTRTGVAERVEQARQVAEQVAAETDDAVSFEAFVEHAKQYPEYTNASSEMLEVAYAQFLQDTGVTVAVNGDNLSFAGFVNYLRSTPEGATLTVGEMGRRFQQLAKQQNMNKEADYGRQDLLHSEGLSGQPDQRSGRQSRSVPEAAGRTEGEAGARRGDQSGSQAGRGSEVRSAGQNQEGTGSYRAVKVNGNPMTEVRPEAYTPEMRDLVDQYAAIGVNAHIVIEGYPIDADGHYADGITVFNTDGTTDVFLQVVGAHAMPERSDHEKAHVVLGRNPQVKEQAIAALGKAMSEKELLDLCNAYLPMYGAAYANSDDLIGDLLVEVICDAYANLDRAKAGAPKYHDAVSGVIEAQLQSYSAYYGQDVTLTDDAGNLVVESDGNGHSTFSMSTYQDSGRDILTQWMGKAVVNGDLTQQDADDIVNTLDLIYDICEKARGKYAPFDAWSEAKVVVNEQGNPVFSVVKANGEYAMNLDFSLVCKKRRTLDAVLNELVKQGLADNLSTNQEQIVEINNLIRSYGFEVACDLCFVDAKRYRQSAVADKFVKLYNDLVLSMIPKNSGLKPHYFNFGQSTVVSNAGSGIHELPDTELNFSKIDKILKTKGEKSVDYKVAKLLKESPQDRKLTLRGDFLSTRGFDTINRENPRVLKLFNAKKGSGGPKSAVSDVQYLNEVLTSKTFTPEKAYAVGGVRIQSFSDYVPRMVFDYVQMIADLAAKKLPAHAYTKEELFVKQFGLTGMKINMSLIPKIVEGGIAPGLDADGNYAWANESFDFDEAKRIQKAEGYSRNCGTVAVGVSDEHIRKMMADPDIRMIIPYHLSALNPVVAKMNNIKAFKNYEPVQNTRRPNDKTGKRLDKSVASDKKLLNEMPDFNTKMRELGDPRAAAEFYVRWCEDNNLLPKFDQFAYKTIDGMPVEKDGKRVIDENYYKLLEDFTVYDNGEYVEQTGLTMTFPTEDSAFGSMKDLINRGLSDDALLEAKRDEDVPKIVDKIKQMKFSVSDWKPDLDSTEWDIVHSVMNNGRGTDITSIDKMFFESTKGKSVFGIYSTDNDTLLYASRDKEAAREHQFVTLAREEYQNGKLTDTSAEGLRAWGEAVRVQLDANSGNVGDAVASGRLGGDADIYGEQPRLYASTALRNVLENIFKTEESRRANSVTEQPAQASEESGAYSLPRTKYFAIDSTGKSLTEDQAEYFKNSKVRDSEGRLMPVYHGTPKGGFTEFKLPEFFSTLMSAQGAGYYFTDRANAEQYMKSVNKKKVPGAKKQLYEVYLNITSPLEIGEYSRSITPEQFKAVVRLGNREWFKTDWMAFAADGSKADNQKLAFEDLLDKYTDKIFGNSGNRDSDILAELTRAFEGGDETILEAMSKGFNADGVRYSDSYGDIWVAWSSNQIKSTANEHPTNNPDIRYSVTPAFEKWYQETYDEEFTSSQLKRRLQTAESRAEQAEHDRKAAELKNTIDSQMNLTAWLMHHTKKLREQKRAMNEKLAEARKEKTEAVKAAVAETKEIERAKAAVQHDADRMAERRAAAKRLRIREDAYKQKVTEMKENQKLKRNAAKAVLRDSKLAAKRRAEIEAEQGLVDTIRKNPKQRTGVEKLQDAAQVLRTLGRSAYRNFVNMAEAIDRFSKRQAEGMRAGTLVNILGGTSSTVESMFKKGLVDRAGNRIGESMSDVFLCWDEAHKKVNEGMQALLQDFMLHRHNIDRMSIVARAESALETFENTHEWLRDMDSKEFARLVAMTEKEAEKSGKQEAQRQAFQYARLIREYNEAQNKPIFADDKGNPVTAETSQKMVDKYLAENDWLLEKANGIYEWWDKFMREWAVGDTISEAEYNRMRQMYPHYVPTYRTDRNGVGGSGFVGNGAASVSKAVKKAKGSTAEVMNIEDSFSNIVSKIVRLNRLNEMYMNIIDTAMLDDEGLFSDMAYFDWDSSWQSGEYAKALMGDASLGDLLEDSVDDAEKTGLEKVGNDYKLTARRDGRKYTTFISEDLYKSIGNVTGHLANDLEEGLLKVGNTLTGPMKTAITGINPTFAVRNLSRDLPTAIINSISGLAFPKYYAQAAKEIAQNSEHWQTFQALGGTNATYYNDNKGFVGAMSGKTNLGSKAVGALGALNEVTEAQTRFAEYLATIDKLGDTYENRLQGIKNSAEVTVDFSRKGRYGKVINAWVPYWNPAVQGIDKTIRSLIESPDGAAVWKQASKTLGRAAMTTILWETVLQAVLHALDRDDEWEELNDRTKDTYYCIPLKDSKTFLKIPKNREWGAILGTPFMRMLEWANGREDPFENYIETSIEPNFLPPAIFRPDAGGGFTSDIIGVSQALDLAKNEDFAGRTIVPYSYQQGTLSQQYDNETSWASKQLGKLLNWSPMQIDYILGDYFGDFGEMFIQATSEATLTGEQNPAQTALDIVTNPFVADARYSNYAVNKYYDLMDDLDRVVQDRKNQLGTDGAKETIEYQTQKAVDTLYGKAITELNREVREMADGPEKDAAKEQIAQLAREAVEFYNDSISGKILQPELTANYANYSKAVSDELIQMDELSKDYNFKPRTSASKSYVDPRSSKNEYVLSEDQQEYYMELYVEAYNETFERVIQSSRYKSADANRKAAMLEDAKQDVADKAKDELIDWLRKNGVRSTPKK